MERTSKFWDAHFAQKAYKYGEIPNAFLKKELLKLDPVKILFPAEGEGRNAVFAAQIGWKVEAFDWSVEAYKKAMKLAKKHNVSIDYHMGDFLKIPFQENSFDCLALIYAHFPKAFRPIYFKKLNSLFKPGAKLLFEGFGPHHPEYQNRYPNIGGPNDKNMLFSIEEIKRAFPDVEFSKLQEEEIELNEGKGHRGKGYVVRAVGKLKL